MALVVRGHGVPRTGGAAGETLAELAAALPLVTFVVLAAVQLAFLGYGSVGARYAAFAGARAAAVAPVHHRERAAAQAVDGVLDLLPGLRRGGSEIRRTVVRLGRMRDESGMDFAQGRMTLTVRIAVPRLLPLPWIDGVTARCAMPMEPVFP